MVGNSEWTPELSQRWDQEIVRYPDPAVEVLDPRFLAYRIGNTAIERLFTGTRWAEGPVWFGDFRSLVFSDIPNNRMLRYCELTGEVTLFRHPSNYSNGNTRDLQGRLITCEHLSRRITRTEHDGSLTVLLDRFDGKRLNAPNDVVVHSDGAIWFTDPGYGILVGYEGERGRGRTAYSSLPAGCWHRGSRRGSRRSGYAQRAVLFTRRVAALHLLQRHLSRSQRARSHPGLRGNGWQETCVEAASSPMCRPDSPMGCEPTPTATCGPAWAGPDEGRMAFTAARPTAN